MNKKVLYGILFVSIFLLSTATMVQPAHGYEWGVPREAVGVSSEGEVKIFDEDDVDDHLGSGVPLSGLHSGDSDVVGAKSKSLYTEWEPDEEIDYLDDYVAGPAGIPASHDQVVALFQSLADINGTAMGAYPAGTAYGPYGSLAWLANYSLNLAAGTLPGPLAPIAAAAQVEASAAQLALLIALQPYANIIGLFSKDYDGAVLTRDKWNFDEDAEFDPNDPDVEDDEVPFFADPRDWNDVAENLQAYQYYIGSGIDSIQTHWADQSTSSPGWFATLAGGCAQAGPNWVPYETVNNTIWQQLNAISDPILSATLIALMNVSSDLGALLGPPLPTGVFTYRDDYVLGLAGIVDVVVETVYAQFHALIPDKAGFFLGQLIAGQPAMTPTGDFMAKVLEEYNLDEDQETLYDMYGFEYGRDLDGDGVISAVPFGAKSRFTGEDLGGETIYPKAYIEFEWDGAAVIADIEWPDSYFDPKDLLEGEADPKELEDFEIEFPYGEGGTQGTISYKDGDDIFWQMGGVDQIPGYEIPIILGASALSILALVYVIMKKRRA
jgi:hypothetical protein